MFRSLYRIAGTLALLLFVSAPGFAQIPDLNLSSASSANGMIWASVFTRPDGLGNTLTSAYRFGGATFNALVRVHMVDAAGVGIPGIAAADMWLESGLGGLVPCPYNFAPGTWPGYVSIADGPTGPAGAAIFTNAVFGSGWSDVPGLEPCIVMTPWGKVNGTAGGSPPNSNLPIGFNSPDLNGDGVVNLTDLIIFAGSYMGTYSYSCDYFWDGTLNLSDLVLFAGALGATCP